MAIIKTTAGIFDQIIERANENRQERDKVKRLTFHKLRHTFASLLLSKGKDIADVSRLLGIARSRLRLIVTSSAENDRDAGTSDKYSIMMYPRRRRRLSSEVVKEHPVKQLELDACPLCDSHIIPRFVFDWLLESSPTGYMRSGLAPNLRSSERMMND